MKRRVISVLLITVMALSLTACGGGGSSENSSKDGGELNLYVWTEYIPDSVISDFEDETGIKVNMSTFSSNEDMLAKVKSESEGAFDVIQPSDYMIEQMIAQDMLEKIDTEKLTNLSNIGEAYLNPSYDPTGEYSVPYMGGVAAIAVNTDKISTEVTKYADLFTEDFKNSLVVLDDFRAVIGMSARSLGYSMNETDTAKLDEIKAQTLSLKDNVKLYDSDSPKSALISGDCAAGYCWNAEIALAMDENPSIEIVYPEEGAYLFMDNWVIPKGAKNVEAATEFINYMLKAETAQAVSEEFPYLQPNDAAVELLGEDYVNNLAKNVPADVIEKGEYIQNLDTDTLAIYDGIWTELKK